MSHHQMHPARQMAGQRLPVPSGVPGLLGAPQPPLSSSSSSSSTNAGGPLLGTSVVRPLPPPETALTRRLTDLLLLAPISLNLAEMTAADWRLIARLDNETQLEQAARVHRCTVSCRGENLVALHCVQWNSMRCSFRLLYVRNKGDLFSQGQHNHAQTAPLWELPMMPMTRLPRPRFIAQTQTQALHGTSVVRPPPPEVLTPEKQTISPNQSVTTATSTSNEPSSSNANDQQPKRRRNRKLGPEWRLVRQLINESELRQLGFQPNGRRKKQYVDCPWGAPCQARLCLEKDQLTLYESGQHSHIRQAAASNEEGEGPSGGTSSTAGGSIAASRPEEAQMEEGQTGGVPQKHKSRKRRAQGNANISDEQRPKQPQQQPLKMVISLGVNVEADDNAASTTPMDTTTIPPSSNSCSSANNDNTSIVRNFLITSNNTNSANGISRGEGGGTVTMASSHFSARTTTTTSSTCIVHKGQCQSNSSNQDIAVANILGQLAPTPPLFNLLLAAGGQLPVADTSTVASSSSCSSSSDASTAANFFEPLTPENSVVGHHQQQRTTESVQTQTSDEASTTAASATTTPRLLVTPFVPEIVIISSDDEEEEEEQPTKKGKESQVQSQQSEAIGQVPVAPEGQTMGGGEHPAVDGNQAVGQQIAADELVMLTGLGRGGEGVAVNTAHEELRNSRGAISNQTISQQQQVERVMPGAVENGGQQQQGGVIVRNTVVASIEQQSSSAAANAAALLAACSSSNVPTGRGELTNNANSNLARADQAVQAGHVEQQQQPHHFHLFNLAELFRKVCWRFQMQFRVEGAKFVIKRVDPDQRIGDLLLFEDRGHLIVVTEYRERHSVQPDGRLLGQWVQKQSRWVKSDIEQFMTAVRGRCDQMLTSQPHLEP